MYRLWMYAHMYIIYLFVCMDEENVTPCGATHSYIVFASCAEGFATGQHCPFLLRRRRSQQSYSSLPHLRLGCWSLYRWCGELLARWIPMMTRLLRTSTSCKQIHRCRADDWTKIPQNVVVVAKIMMRQPIENLVTCQILRSMKRKRQSLKYILH